MLYLAIVKDGDAFKKWIDWIDKNPRCHTNCLALPQGDPRYCENDRCAFHIGDCFMLQSLGSYLNVAVPFCGITPYTPPDPVKASAAELKKAYDETIGQFPIVPPELKLKRDEFDKLMSAYESAISEAEKVRSKIDQALLKDARLAQIMTELNLLINAKGYSRHNTLVDILTLQLTGNGSKQLQSLAAKIAAEEPANPFFRYVASRGSDSTEPLSIVLNECPSETEEPHSRSQWAWEREQSEAAWKNSMYWDCIFIARVWIKNDPLPEESGKNNFFEQAALDHYYTLLNNLAQTKQLVEQVIDQMKKFKNGPIVLEFPLPKVTFPVWPPMSVPSFDDLFGGGAGSSGSGRINKDLRRWAVD